MKLKSRVAVALLPLVLSAWALTGCAGTAPIAADPPPESTEPTMEAAVAWLDGGRMIGLVTWGSSSCVPSAGPASAEGQEITVAVIDHTSGPCTADYAPRASEMAVPAGVDPHQPVTVHLTYLDQTVELTLDGNPELTGTPGDPTDYQPSAGWFNDHGLALLTWGSSTCRPEVADLQEASDGITVTFTSHEGACTMDMVPRMTILGVEQVDRDRTLTLSGDGLDATIPVF